MSVRMNATLYSEVARIERGDFLRFHCEALSHLRNDVQRYFFGVYYPRWHAFYIEEVREVIGNMGYTELKHFPAYPLDVYRREDGETYRTEDFTVDGVIVIGEPQNQRDDGVKRLKIVSVDDELLRTRNGGGDAARTIRSGRRQGNLLPAIRNTWGGATMAGLFGTTKGGSASNNNSSGGGGATSTMVMSVTTSAGVGAVPAEVRLDGEVVALLEQLRDAYVLHAGGGIPEIGLKAMGKPFRKAAEDGRRYMTLQGMERLVRDSRAFGLAQPSSLGQTKTCRGDIRDVASTLYNAFPHSGDEDLVAADLTTTMGSMRGPAATEGSGAGPVGGNTVLAASVAALPASGGVDYDVFMDFVRGHMNATRKKAVWDIFTKLDYDSDGHVAIHDIQAMFNAQEHPVVVRDGFFSAEGLLKGFLVIWDENHVQHGMVPYSEFLDYYNGLSAIIEDDDVFLGILATTWKMPIFARSCLQNRFAR